MRIQTRWKTLKSVEDVAEFCRDLEINFCTVREMLLCREEYATTRNPFRKRHLRHYFKYGHFEGYEKSKIEILFIKIVLWIKKHKKF